MAENFGGDIVSRAGGILGNDNAVAAPSADTAALDGELSNGERSALIDALLIRQSVLPSGPYAQVAQSVLEANSRAAEADLRAAMLRAEARELNWLPSIGPSISLSSLGSVVAGLLIEQTLFDGGAKRAEREFARADVEVAAVALAQDTNDRVYQALDLYLTAQASEARAAVNEGGMARMERFEYVMSERVNAGINDRADLQLVQQKLTQMRSDVLEDRENANSARAELAAMSATSLDGVSGISSLGDVVGTAQPLDVMKTQAEGTRGLAEARALQAGYMPNISASGTVGVSDSAGIDVGIPNGLGFGRGADMAAIDAMGEAAELQVAEQREDSAREVAAVQGQITSLRRQQGNIQTIISQAQDNYTLFEEQLRAGQRTVPEVVGVFRTKLDAEREAVALRYDLARQELILARIYGTLVDGDDI
ncbi:TolC family protein [Octadecabacter sp. 1_MG-2023]|uniref:TolC family protein n=1 Tax=unclassified Octadecabacter TaxID=196158 RepID=UPI001C08BC9E|nr:MULTISPECIES: TolC family protein [unclassified Octadecabacter]MBU2992982.1 TolC family protein [Octadecabacter sp. B2R22]MDO6733566.1 TolC family protein [Octadecabacter sp. 1_MG-2023]